MKFSPIRKKRRLTISTASQLFSQEADLAHKEAQEDTVLSLTLIRLLVVETVVRSQAGSKDLISVDFPIHLKFLNNSSEAEVRLSADAQSNILFTG